MAFFTLAPGLLLLTKGFNPVVLFMSAVLLLILIFDRRIRWVIENKIWFRFHYAFFFLSYVVCGLLYKFNVIGFEFTVLLFMLVLFFSTFGLTKRWGDLGEVDEDSK